MNEDLKKHLTIHLPNPHINFIVIDNCKYCKLDKRKQYGNLFNRPRHITRNSVFINYYQLEYSRFYQNQNQNQNQYHHSNTIIPTNNRTSLSSPLPPSPVIVIDEFENIDSPPLNDTVSLSNLNNNTDVTIYLRGIRKLEKCAICYDNLKSFQIIRTLNCQHFFHQKCIDRWFERHNSCPICRDDI